MTPTSEAVTWGSPLYTFRWLLDSGSCGVRWGKGPSEQPPLRGVSSQGPLSLGEPFPGTPEGSCARVSRARVSALGGLSAAGTRGVRIRPGPLQPAIPHESQQSRAE